MPAATTMEAQSHDSSSHSEHVTRHQDAEPSMPVSSVLSPKTARLWKQMSEKIDSISQIMKDLSLLRLSHEVPSSVPEVITEAYRLSGDLNYTVWQLSLCFDLGLDTDIDPSLSMEPTSAQELTRHASDHHKSDADSDGLCEVEQPVPDEWDFSRNTSHHVSPAVAGGADVEMSSHTESSRTASLRTASSRTLSPDIVPRDNEVGAQ